MTKTATRILHQNVAWPYERPTPKFPASYGLTPGQSAVLLSRDVVEARRRLHLWANELELLPSGLFSQHGGGGRNLVELSLWGSCHRHHQLRRHICTHTRLTAFFPGLPG